MNERTDPASEHSFILDTPRGPIHGLVQHPGGAPQRRPAVVICHGFKGFMEWGFFPPLAELLVSRGYAVVRFNVIGSGMEPGDALVTDLEAFRHATFSGDVADVLAVLAAVRSGEVGGSVDGGPSIDTDHLALLGHSRGGGAALLAASQSPWDRDLRALVTWAAVSTFDRADGVVKAAWRRDGEIVIENGRTGQRLPIDVAVLDDLETHRRDLDMAAAARRRKAPWLIVHGTDDPTVPVDEARAHAAHAEGISELLEVAAADHTFGAKHPFLGPTPHLIEVFNATQTWLRRYLTGK